MSTQEQTFGFTSFAETLSGRMAMLGFSLAVITEVLTGQGIVGQLAALWSF
ncbi:chlorophyll a/b-binding protein [Acaryochloris sp. IP29b_bin.148]|uniref:chlorophyll a/b-binding protein n=1 Tax=Acaryochloris sp. IP29b_bin.148 TaxID=2969218 RepID=UPI002608E804|nr:chlorophyll a/b-binding protein [Acaryochloris sp. IP29b_bin.148]